MRVVFISSGRLGLCFPSGRPSTWLLCLLGVPFPLRPCYLLDHIMAGFGVVSLTGLFFLLSVPGLFSWCSSMRWVPSSCCFSCYPLLPGCASCAWGVRPLLFLRRLMPSLLSLGSGASLYGSSSFLSEVFLHCPDFSSSSSSWLVSFGFPSVGTGFSFPLSFCSLCVHGSGALFFFPTTFFPCRIISGGPLSIASLLWSWSSLPGIMLPLSFHCHSFRGPLSIFGLVPHLSVVSFRIDGLILLCQLSPVFCRVLSPFGCTSVGGSSISSPLDSPSSWRLVFLHGSSPSRSPSSTASSGHLRLLLYLSWSSPSSAVLRFSVLSTSLVVVSFSLSPCLVTPWGFLLFAWATGGFVQCSLLSLCRVASTFLFPFCNPSSYGLHPDISMSAFPGYCLFRSSALLFLFVWALGRLAWFPCPASPSLVSIPLSFLQVVSSCPSLGALLTRSNLRYTPRRGLPLGRVSFWLASWRFIMVPIPHGSPLLLVALLLVPPRSCAGVFLAFDFLLGTFPFTWAPTCCFLCLLSVPSVCPPLALF